MAHGDADYYNPRAHPWDLAHDFASQPSTLATPPVQFVEPDLLQRFVWRASVIAKRGPLISGNLRAGSTETNIIAGITVTGDALCKSTNVIYRLDTESARAFLGQYVTLP
jgi:hypothetical protein